MSIKPSQQPHSPSLLRTKTATKCLKSLSRQKCQRWAWAKPHKASKTNPSPFTCSFLFLCTHLYLWSLPVLEKPRESYTLPTQRFPVHARAARQERGWQQLAGTCGHKRPLECTRTSAQPQLHIQFVGAFQTTKGFWWSKVNIIFCMSQYDSAGRAQR